MMYQLLVSKGTKINNNSSFHLPFPTCYPTTVKDLRRAPAKVSLPSIFFWPATARTHRNSTNHEKKIFLKKKIDAINQTHSNFLSH
jgi:hypothetical protein